MHLPPTNPSAQVTAALEAVWSAIQGRHPEVPAVFLTISHRPLGRHRAAHFAPDTWITRKGEQRPEVVIGGEQLHRPASEVLAVLLHEAAHGVAWVRGISDCTRQGRYHNRRYRPIAAALGLETERSGTYGWGLTTLAAGTADRYVDQLYQLAGALTVSARPKSATRAGNNLQVAICGCPRRIRVAPRVLAAGAILCNICRIEFMLDNVQR